MDLEKELVSKILPYSEFRINLILESTTRIRNLKSNHRSFIPHLPIIRKIRVQILEKKFYNAIYLREKRFSMKRSFPFHFDRVNLIKNEKKMILLFLKATHLEVILLRWSYMIIFTLFPARVLLATALPWKTRMERKNTLWKNCKKEKRRRTLRRTVGCLRWSIIEVINNSWKRRWTDTEGIGGWIGVNWIPAIVAG